MNLNKNETANIELLVQRGVPRVWAIMLATELNHSDYMLQPPEGVNEWMAGAMFWWTSEETGEYWMGLSQAIAEELNEKAFI